MKKSTIHFGAAGELLVQNMLLKYRVDSAAITTDFGIDLVAYSPENNRPFTVQVKTQQEPTNGGGKGKLSMGWDLRDNSPAELICLVVYVFRI